MTFTTYDSFLFSHIISMTAFYFVIHKCALYYHYFITNH